MVQAYAQIASADAVLEMIDKAGEKLADSMPDPDTWGTSPSQAASAQLAEARFAAG